MIPLHVCFLQALQRPPDLEQIAKLTQRETNMQKKSAVPMTQYPIDRTRESINDPKSSETAMGMSGSPPITRTAMEVL